MPNSSRNSCKSSETLKERKHRRRESDSSFRDVRSNRWEAVETTAIKCNKSSRKNVSEEKSVENKADFLFLKWSELLKPTASRCNFWRLFDIIVSPSAGVHGTSVPNNYAEWTGETKISIVTQFRGDLGFTTLRAKTPKPQPSQPRAH